MDDNRSMWSAVYYRYLAHVDSAVIVESLILHPSQAAAG